MFCCLAQYTPRWKFFSSIESTWESGSLKDIIPAEATPVALEYALDSEFAIRVPSQKRTERRQKRCRGWMRGLKTESKQDLLWKGVHISIGYTSSNLNVDRYPLQSYIHTLRNDVSRQIIFYHPSKDKIAGYLFLSHLFPWPRS